MKQIKYFLLIVTFAIVLVSCEKDSLSPENQNLGWGKDTTTSFVINAIWGSSANDIFVVGHDGRVANYNGMVWNTGYSGTGSRLYDVWGSSGEDVYAVAELERVPHFDGIKWSLWESDLLYQYGIWGSSANNIYVAGHNGYIGHYDGTTWTKFRPGGLLTLWAVWGSSASDVFVVGGYGEGTAVVFHFDGKNWNSMDPNTDSSALDYVWGTSSSNVYVLGGNSIIHYDGNDWSTVWEGQAISGIWGSSSTDIYAVGMNGFVIHWDGSVWTKVDIGTNDNLKDIWGTSENNIYIVGGTNDWESGVIYRFGPQQ